MNAVRPFGKERASASPAKTATSESAPRHHVSDRPITSRTGSYPSRTMPSTSSPVTVTPFARRDALIPGHACGLRVHPEPTGMLLLGSLPAIPASLAPARVRGAHDEAEQPDDQHDDGDPPQCLQREARTEEDQSQQKNEKQRNHSYQPPSLLVPGECKNTRSIFLVSPLLLRALNTVSLR